mmetsp:Transcript_5362/g.13828  ORF Transcript_5362/g.13828 Transcript_5362/m.13828 type:complete len:173 (+) Transcript_5362:2257-2775(+)
MPLKSSSSLGSPIATSSAMPLALLLLLLLCLSARVLAQFGTTTTSTTTTTTTTTTTSTTTTNQGFLPDDKKPQACMDLMNEPFQCKNAYEKYGLECRWDDDLSVCFDASIERPVYIEKPEECNLIETQFRCEYLHGGVGGALEQLCEWDYYNNKCQAFSGLVRPSSEYNEGG